MSADEHRREQSEEELNEQGVDTAAEASAAGDQDSSDEVAGLREQAKELQEQVLRSQAEMQNVRRRAEIDVE